MARTLTDETSLEIAVQIVRDHLDDGVERLTIYEQTDDLLDDDEMGEPSDDDYTYIHDRVNELLAELIQTLSSN